MGMHDARSVANQIIERAHQSQRAITHLEVQKLLYFCHAWMLGLYQEPLIEQPIEAWQYGPVVPDVYNSLRRHGGEPITRLIPGVAKDEYSEIEADIIDQVFQKYGGLTVGQLIAATHATGAPWAQTWDKYGPSGHAVIPDPIIEDYYADKARNT